MRFLISLYFLLIASAFAEELPYLTSDCDSLCLVEGIVNAYNGKLVQVDHDFVVQGSDPLEMSRTYDGGHHFDSEFGYGIGCSYPSLVRTEMRDDKIFAYVEMRQGLEVLFRLHKKDGKFYGELATEYYKTGFTNCSEALLHGDTSLYALRIVIDKLQAIVTLGDGTKRYYEFVFGTYLNGGYFRLFLEERNNGNKRHFSYTSPTVPFALQRIWTTNSDETLTLNSLDFYYENNFIYVLGSNKQTAAYCLHYEKGKVKKGNIIHGFRATDVRELLKATITNHYPEVYYEHSHNARSLGNLFSRQKVYTKEGKFLEVVYDDYKRVKELRSSGSDKPVYTFDYHTNYTDVVDSNGAKRRYEFSKRRLVLFSEPQRKQKFDWDSKGQLTTHTFLSSENKPLSKRLFQYDEKGNILEANVVGTICRVGSQDHASVKYVYDDQNRLIRENQNGEVEYQTYYKGDTRLISKKLTVVANQVVEREFFEYDKNAILIKKIHDDGSKPDRNDLTDVTCRRITEIVPQLNPDLFGLTLPYQTIESYLDLRTGQKKLLSKKEYVYTKGNFVSEEKSYDSEGVYQFSKYYEYNKRFELIKETNPLGHATVFEYDDSGNKIYEKKKGSGKKNHYRYNLSDQLIEESVECDHAITLRTSHEYDALDNKIATTDIYGKKTTCAFDLNSREVKRTDSFGKTEELEYDPFDNVISFQDKDGYKTTNTFSLLKKPLEIRYPDGSKETFVYNLQGHLIQETKRDGRRLEFAVDYKGRILEEKTFSKNNELLRNCSFTYKGSNLICETDCLGQMTHHQYDDAGRRIATTKGEATTYFEYDSLGRLYKTKTDDCVKIKNFDALDRVIEERIEDLSGNIFSKSEYEYDVLGNQTVVRKYRDASQFEETKTVYNALSQPVLHSDGLGNAYRTQYTYTNVLKKESEDPLQRLTVEIFDCQGRLKTYQRWSKNRTLIAQSHQQYDGRGNLTTIVHDVIYEGKVIDHFTVESIFDSMNQKIEETEQKTKTTKWTYKNGLLTSIINPDGTVLNYKYDPLNRIRELTSSDGSVNYSYAYDANDQLITVRDRINHLVNERKYDALSRVIEEKLGNGLKLSYEYDSANRCVMFKFCDGTIQSGYTPIALKKAVRLKKGAPIYTYAQECDWLGRPLKVSLPNDKEIKLTWDFNGRCTSVLSSDYEEQIHYNTVGKADAIEVRDAQGFYQTDYSYDELDQLTSEQGFFSQVFAFDSLNNRRVKNASSLTVNDHNQVLNDASHVYTYDLNGRRQTKGYVSYRYDALGRLIQISSSDSSIAYIYDSFGRRIRSISSDQATDYLYSFDVEIGSFQNGLKEFRQLDDGHETVALELDGKVYSPVTNHRGDIVQLMDLEGVKVNYRYDAFGNSVCAGSVASPWLFFGQRFNPRTGLYHFCRREYDPLLGNWITPDPARYLDGPNLYAYVHNNPLTYVDPYGLFWAEAKDWGRGVTRGVVDDFSWGVSEIALGEYQSESLFGTVGYYSGASASFAAGLLTGSSELKVAKEAITLVGKSVAKGCRALKAMRATIAAVDVAKTLPTKEILEVTSKATKSLTVTVVEKKAKNVGESFKILTPRQLRESLSNLKNYSRDDLIQAAKKLGLHDKGNLKSQWLNMIDRRGRTRLKIHPKDNKTDYPHIHLYDKKGRSLDVDLQIVNPTSREAHIPYGK